MACKNCTAGLLPQEFIVVRNIFCNEYSKCSFARKQSQYVSMNILFLIILGVAFQLTWLFQGKQDMKLIAIINAVSRLFSVLMVFALVHSENHLYLYCICYAITFLLSAALGILLARKKYGLKVRLCKIADAISEIKDGWYLFISQAMSKIFSGIGTTVLGAVATPSIVGIYSAIYKIPYIMVLFFSPISQALYPHISVCFSKSFRKWAQDSHHRCKTRYSSFRVSRTCNYTFQTI
ncbi:MAG: oligosaccharide flippase family protein [Faecalibacterium prausnitzii]